MENVPPLEPENFDPTSRSDLRYPTGDSEYQAVALAYGDYADMERPTLLYLRYDFHLLDAVDAGVRPPVGATLRLGDFECVFEEAQLHARPLRHFTSFEAGRENLNPHLERWEYFSELSGRGRLSFELRHFAVSNYDEGAKGPRDCVGTFGDWTPYVPPRRPATTFSSPPPDTFVVSPLLRRLRSGFRDVQDKKTSPLVEGYFLLTALEREFGDGQVSRKDRLAAAKALNVHIDVLDLLGDITAADDEQYGRKVGKPGKVRVRPLQGRVTREELLWVFRIAQLLMLRLADPQHRVNHLALTDESAYTSTEDGSSG